MVFGEDDANSLMIWRELDEKTERQQPNLSNGSLFEKNHRRYYMEPRVKPIYLTITRSL
jgi:flagellar biosynthesis/type III secretory pathway chaperone